MIGYTGDIELLTRENVFFRKVLYTTQYEQLVLMALQPGEDIGEEIHGDTDQFFRFESGEGMVVMDGKETVVGDGYAVIVPAGTKHNVINTSKTQLLKLYTIYAPPHHKDGTVHKTKAEAMADEKDHL